MQVLSASSEIFPLVKTGGLADVAGALPGALQAHGVRTRTLIPGYPAVLERISSATVSASVQVMNENATLLTSHSEGLDLLILDCPSLFRRNGGLYRDETGRDHIDNWRRFAALSQVTSLIAAGAVDGWIPDVVHLHDWHTALAACYMRSMELNTPTVLTIHNLAFQGHFSSEIFAELGLPWSLFTTDVLEYHGGISFLKGGIVSSDRVTTVSPTYAREILTPELGMGLDGILLTRRGSLRGIVNGIDHAVWDPRTDIHIPATFDAKSLSRRKRNKARIQEQFGLDRSEGAILSVISRLTWQKGIDLLAPIVPGIVDRGARLIVFGEGDPDVLYPLLEQARPYPGKVVVHVGFSEVGAHLLHAGSDIVLQPSRFEPCGLTQLYALRYGAIPIVARTGGLAETIIDANEAAMAAHASTGFQFQPGSVEDFYHAIDRALAAFDRPDFWRRLQYQAMKADFGWERSAERYAELYRELVARPPANRQ